MADQVCIIGKHITISGTVSGAEDLIVEGRIEGAVKLANHLTVESSGVVQADVDVEDLTVNGAVHGDTEASRSISINAGAKVEGNIRAPRIIIEDGARFKGRIDMDVDLPDNIEA